VKSKVSGLPLCRLGTPDPWNVA